MESDTVFIESVTGDIFPVATEEVIADATVDVGGTVTVLPDGTQLFSCTFCNKSFNHRSNWRRHVANVHKVRTRVNSTIKCIECKVQYKRIHQLRDHLTLHHKLEMSEEEQRFSNISEFKKWKCEEERKNLCSYVLKQGVRKNREGERYFYICHRSGKHVPKVINRKRNLKSQGTCKLGMYCTSTISVLDTGHEVVARYCRHHYGHGGVTTLVRISPAEQTAIAETVSKGVSFEKVLDEIRDSLSNKDHFQLHLLQRKDFQRIKKTYETKGQNLEMIDTESLNLWVQSCCQMENSPILLYNQPASIDVGKTVEEDFMLVIMTEYQKHILLASSKKVVCVDQIYRKRGARFYITVIFVMDEYGLGFPTSFCLSHKVDKTVLAQYYQAIRDAAGPIESEYLMSDWNDIFYTAWKDVMNEDAKWLWNSWNVDSNWRGQLRIFKGKTEKRGEVYKKMRNLLECQSLSVFTNMFETVIKDLVSDVECKDLGKYIEQHYLPTSSMWAYCHRKDIGLSTSIHLEILHRTFRFCTREGMKRRIDKFIFVIMKFVRDKILDRLSRIGKEKHTLALANINWCHKSGLDIDSGNVSSLSEREWHVKSTVSDERFHVVLENDSCPELCSLVCEDCDICVHMFTCTCNDNLINANLCEHIHAVALNCLALKFSPPPSPMNFDDDDDDDDDNDCSNTLHKNSDELLYQVLQKNHQLYKKIKTNKFNLSSCALQTIMQNLDDCMDICSGRTDLLKKPDTENSPLSTLTYVDTVPAKEVDKPTVFIDNQHPATKLNLPQNAATLSPYIIIIQNK